jgi:hypothetical protein
MSKDDELRDILRKTAQEIAEKQGNPRTWLSWLVYLLARLEEQATNDNPANKDAFIEMLAALQDEIRNRTKTGGWH